MYQLAFLKKGCFSLDFNIDIVTSEGTQGVQGRGTEAQGGLQRLNSPGADRDLCACRGRKRGEHTVTGNGDKRRHAAQGAEKSGRVWRVASAGYVQVGGALHRERRWGAGEKNRGI